MGIKPKLRIAQIAPIIERVPPKKYGGTERVIYSLTEELVKRGHQVTLFATADSQTSAKLVSVFPQSLREAKVKNIYGGNNWTLLNLATAFNMQDEFDIIHDHVGSLSIPTANLSQTPILMTIHGAFNQENRPLYESATNLNFVSISKSQMSSMPFLNYAANIYNGLPLNDYPYSAQHGKYLLFVGRICQEKGLHSAIKVAKFLEIPLIIAAKLDQSVEADLEYFKRYIRPELKQKDQIYWVGEVDEKMRNKLMKEALCLLHPANWQEPFGLTLIESMACGTPVVAFNQGSIPEIISHGVTGFVVSNTEEMIRAISHVRYLDRASCRSYALENFSAEKMADQYEEVYYKILAQKSAQDLADAFVMSKVPEIIKTPNSRDDWEAYALDIKPPKKRD